MTFQGSTLERGVEYMTATLVFCEKIKLKLHGCRFHMRKYEITFRRRWDYNESR